MQGTFASIFTFVFVLESNQPSVEMLVVGVLLSVGRRGRLVGRRIGDESGEAN